MANKLSKEELLKLVDEMEENGEIDLTRLHEKAQLKSTQISHRQSLTNPNTKEDSDYGNLEQSFPRKLGEEILMNAPEERGVTIAPGETVARMDMFEDEWERNGSKRRKTVNRSQHETDKALSQLKELGVRDENYAKVKLGLLGYREYLIGKEGLLDGKRFKSILKKLVGYQGIGHNLSKEQRILTVETICLRCNGEDEQFNEWVENISAILVRRWQTNYRRLREENKCSKADIPSKIKEFNIPKYIDRAIKYIEVYCEQNYGKLLDGTHFATKAERLLFSVIVGLISLNYNAEQIIYAIIRPVLPERDYKQKSVKEFYGRSFKNKYYESTILHVLDVMGNVKNDDIKTTARELHSLLRNPTTELLDRPYETLMIPNCVELKQVVRKGRICNEIRSICQYTEYRFTNGLPERQQIRLRKVIADFMTLAELGNEEIAKLDRYLDYEKYKELSNYVNEIVNDKRLLDFSKREEIIRANCELPDRRSNFFTENSNQIEIFRICSEFIYGEPNY